MNLDARPSGIVSPLVLPEIVTFPEEVDISNATRLGGDLIVAMRPDVSVVIADLASTRFCDSSGIRTLLVGRDYACENGIDFRVVMPSPAVRRTFHVIGADTLLQLYPTLMAALSNRPPEDAPGDDEPAKSASPDSDAP